MDDKTEFLPVAVLREPKNKLRIVDKESVAYLELRDSIRDHGILQPLLVRPVEGGYEIIEGLYRLTGAKEVGLEKVPCLIREATDDEVLVLQLQANAISPDTQLAEYAQQLKKLMQRDPNMTKRELACLIRKSPQWISKCLDLTRLLRNIQVMVDRGEIPAENAYMLAKIPRSMQMDYVDRAKIMPRKEFRSFGGSLREAVHGGGQAGKDGRLLLGQVRAGRLSQIAEGDRGRKEVQQH